LNTATPVYLGEIDPDTPLPFSVTIPFTAPTSLATNSTTTSISTSNTSASNSTSTTRGAGRFGNFSNIFAGNGSTPGGFARGFNGSLASGASVSLQLTLSYKDGFSKNQGQSFSVRTAVKTASQLFGGGVSSTPQVSSGPDYLTYLAYGVVAAVAVTLVAGALLLRRYRARRLANLPQEERGEPTVI